MFEDYDYQYESYEQESVIYGPPTYDDFMATSIEFVAATTHSWKPSYTEVINLGLVTYSGKFYLYRE